MILLTALYIINILVILALMCTLILIIHDMKYGLYWSVVRAIRFGDRRGVKYISRNPAYLLYMLFIVVLFFINMTLIGQLMENKILSRPIFILLLSPLAWGCVLALIRMNSSRIKKLMNKQ